MFELISIICYVVIGFGVGGIAFKGKDKEGIIKQFRSFRKDKEEEILSMKQGKEKQKIYQCLDRVGGVWGYFF